MNHPSPFEDLERALENLKSFSRLVNNASLASSISQQELNSCTPTTGFSFKKIIDLAYRVVNVFSNNEALAPDLIEQVQKSGDVVKKYFPLIHLLENGDSQQRKFALEIKEVVDNFNKSIDREVNRASPASQWVARFLPSKGGFFIGERLAKIELPPQTAVRIHFPVPSKGSSFQEGLVATEKISTLSMSAMPLVKPSSQTLELFAMKAIALLVKSDLLLHSEARDFVRNKPVKILLDKESQAMVISQVIEPIPGQIIEISGAFKWDAATSLYNILSKACSLSTSSVQTGFPHAIQRHGWALSEALMPFCLSLPNRQPNFEDLHIIQKKIAMGLLPGGGLAAKARLLSRLKKQAFETDRSLFLRLHEMLAQTLCSNSHLPYTSCFQNIISDFFAGLHDCPNIYEQISQIHHGIMQGCAIDPQKALLQSNAMDHSTIGEIDNTPKAIITAAFVKSIEHFAAQQKSKKNRDYVQLMGEILGTPCGLLILHHYSDMSSYDVPALSPFAKILGQALCHQIKDFDFELDVMETDIDISQYLRKMLEDEITFFAMG